MRYLLLGYGTWEHLSDESWAADVADTIALETSLGDRLLAGEVLADVDSATTLRVRDGRVTVTDGPAIAGDDPLGRVLLIDAADLDAALTIARRWPAARRGSVEVRPVGT